MSITTRTPPPGPSRWAEAETLKNQSKRKNRRRIFYSVMSVILLVILCVAAWELAGWYKVREHAQFLASIKGDDQKMKDALDAKQITEQEFWRMHGEQRREQFEKQMDEYFALTSPADRSAWMTNFVQNTVLPREEQRKQWEASGGPTSRPSGNGNNNNNNRPTVAQRTTWYENRNPARSAQFSQFRAAVDTAMRQMGIQPPQHGGRGR